MLLYDIVCKFFANFEERRMELPDFLAIPISLQIKKAIGLFHVHGHVKQCFARYAPTFIQGSGMLAGEIIETLWSPLNHTASSARTMTWYHRQEYLDSHMGDSNWKKLTGMRTSIVSFTSSSTDKSIWHPNSICTVQAMEGSRCSGGRVTDIL